MYKKIVIATVCASFLTGCQTVRDNPNTAAGAILGGLAGAAVGAAVPGNDRRGALIGAGIGMLAGAAIGQYLDQQQRALEQSLAGTPAEVRREGDVLYVSFPSDITFDVDSTRIYPGAYSALDRVAEVLNRYPQSYVDVIGHTDSTGSEAYNLELSRRRAEAVANYLRSRGVLPERIAVYGMGESQPIATNATTEGRARNRRVEIRIIPARA